ncbi:hypothetical protein ACS0TY_015852 [Phlomoides rotata]
MKSTKVKKIKFNTTVEVVLHNTALLGVENHLMHSHSFVNYNPAIDSNKFNLVDPQERKTIGIPVGGWVVIRFHANNPGRI